MYPLRCVEPSLEEPIDVYAVQSELNTNTDDDFALVARKIREARDYLVRRTSRVFLTSTWQLSMDHWGISGYYRRRITIPAAPIQSVVSIKYRNPDGDEITLDPDEYTLNSAKEPAEIIIINGFPALSVRMEPRITVEFIAGYESKELIPETYCQGLYLLALHFWENRNPYVPNELKGIPAGIESIVEMFSVQGLIDRNSGEGSYAYWR